MKRNKIKVVKRGSTGPSVKRKEVVSNSRAAAREMVAKVSDWVTDVQERRAQEAKAALELLFGGNRQPGES